MSEHDNRIIGLEFENKRLKKQNRVLKRQNGNLKAQLKVDVKELRNDCYKEGYKTAENQMQKEIDKLQDEIERLQKLLQDEGILY